jgi:hypothetical protein
VISCTQIPSKIAEIMQTATSALKETALEFQKSTEILDVTPCGRIEIY